MINNKSCNSHRLSYSKDSVYSDVLVKIDVCSIPLDQLYLFCLKHNVHLEINQDHSYIILAEIGINKNMELAQ